MRRNKIVPSFMPTPKDFSPLKKHFLFLAAFLLWALPFHGFFTGKLHLSADATSYYEHTKFLVDNLLQGVFPLWDPVWFCGIPNEFFLRRINPYNPFLLIVFFLRLLGIKATLAYIVFLVFYYFLGAVGFYHCGKKIFRDGKTAFLAFLLFLFSPLGPRIFDSYIVLIVTPMIWFFSFLLAFSQKQKTSLLWGMTFTLMLLANTYIPFYFLIIFIFFVGAMLIVCPQAVKIFGKNLLAFLRQKPVVLIACVLALTLAVLPGIHFLYSTGKTEIVMPARHSLSADQNALSVEKTWITGWGAPEELLYAHYFPNMKHMEYAIFRIPVLMLLILALGFFARVRRETAVLFLWGLGLFVLSAPQAFGLYGFLYHHVFFFKYFKNLHFFLLIGILPIFCMFLAGQWRFLLEYEPRSRWARILFIVFLAVVHVGFTAGFFRWGDRNISTYLSIILSFFFFMLPLQKRLRSQRDLLPWLTLFLVALQPMEINSHLAKNTPPPLALPYDAPYGYQNLIRISMEAKNPAERNAPPDLQKRTGQLYVATQAFSRLFENLSPDVLEKVLPYKFIVYDRIELLVEDEKLFSRLTENFITHKNIALVCDPSAVREQPPLPPEKDSPLFIDKNSGLFQLITSNANTVKIRTNFPSPKFLVYTDNFNEGWKATIQGKEIPLYKAHLAFKGVWVDAGPQEILFRFGNAKDYFWNSLLFFIFYGVLAAMGWPYRGTQKT